MNEARRPSSLATLCRIGAAAPFVTLALYLLQFAIIGLVRETYPVTPEQWFNLFNRSTFLGLIYLNAFDPLSIAILGLLFLALAAALWEPDPSRMAIAAFVALLGVASFVTHRGTLMTGALNLSEAYGHAATLSERASIVGGGWAVLSSTRATPETLGFLFLAVAGALFSLQMLRDPRFPRAIAYLGLSGLAFTLLNHLSLLFVRVIAPPLMIVSGLSWFTWWILVALRLRRLASGVQAGVDPFR